MKVKITTIKLADETLVSEMEAEFLSPTKQEWIIKHCLWAFHNGCGVQLECVPETLTVGQELQRNYEAEQRDHREEVGVPKRKLKGAKVGTGGTNF